MRKMTQGSIARHLIAYALPLILGNLFQLTYNAVDSIVIGKFAGENALAAVSAANPVMTIMILGVSGVSIGASVLMSRFYGAGDEDALRGRHDDRFWRRRVGRRVSARLAAERTGAAADARVERNTGDGDALFAGDLRRIPVHVPIQHSGGGAPERRR